MRSRHGKDDSNPPLSLRGYDPIEDHLRGNIRATIEAILEEELGTLPLRSVGH